MIHQIVSLKAVETSTFILARHTEGSTDYLLPTKIWLSEVTVLREWAKS